jgi:transcriptional regulator of heat shock response
LLSNRYGDTEGQILSALNTALGRFMAFLQQFETVAETNKMSRFRMVSLRILLVVACSHHEQVLAATVESTAPTLQQELVRCRAVVNEGARLRCYDVIALSTEGAALAPEVAGTFGLPVREPGLSAQSAVLDGVIRSASVTVEGWVVVLEDGSVWRQIDSARNAVEPVPGGRVTIRRAALGSYRLSFSRNAGFKVRRIK